MSRQSSRPRRPSTFRSAGLVGLLTLLSRITGMLQSRLLANVLGAGLAGDAFFVAYRIPNLLRRFTAEGTMTSALLPTVTEVETAEGEGAAQDLVARFLGTLASLLLLFCLAALPIMGFVAGFQMLGRLAPGAPWWQQPGILLDMLRGARPAPQDLTLTTTLARIMFPYLILVSLTAGLSGALNLRGRFGLPASVSTFWNLAFLAFGGACLAWGPRSWRSPEGAAVVFAVATLVGGLVQIFLLWPSFRALGFRISWGLHLGDAGVRRALKRMAPGVLGTGIHPINVVISTFLASQLPRGAQVVLFQSSMMGEMVLGIFAASVATVSLPAMSRLVAEGDLPALRESLGSALRGTSVLVIPASVGLAALSTPIIALLLQTGRFDAQAVDLTARTLGFQAVGLLFVATGRIVSQCLYALKDYRWPAFAGLAGVAANIVLSIWLMGPLGAGGIALANGLASLVSLGILAWRLHGTLGRLPYRRVLGGWASMGLASGIMGLLALAGHRALGLGTFHGVAHASLRMFPLMALCALFYGALLLAFRVPEARDLAALARRKLKL